MNVTERIARFVADSRYDDIPEDARHIAKRAILDTIGVTLAGAVEEGSRIAADWAREQGCRDVSGVIGCGFRTTPAEAALVNGASSHALDYDDVNQSIRGHPSVPLLPAVLAVAEERGASGKDVIAAFTIGFEVEAKVGRGVGNSHYQRGWHATATLGTLGAAAAAAWLRNLDEHRIRMALGIATSMASGTRQNFGTMTKPLHPGLAARAGVVAADLASRGFTADEAIIDAPMGFVHLFSPGQDGDPNAIPELGRPWDIVDPGISVKKYPCCFVTHNALDASLDLKAEAGFSAGDVAAVEVHMPEGSAAPLIHPRPRTGLEGKFSMPYAMAAALLDGQPVLSTFEDEAVQRPEAQELLRRCDLVFDPLQGELLAAYADVVVKLRDGRTLSKRSERPRGGPDAPLSREELAIKYRDCARRVLSAEDAERSLTMVESLEDLSDIRELMSLLCRTSVPAAAG